MHFAKKLIDFTAHYCVVVFYMLGTNYSFLHSHSANHLLTFTTKKLKKGGEKKINITLRKKCDINIIFIRLS